eukprot:11205386-Lingulodinium_polyedra.AAC.1
MSPTAPQSASGNGPQVTPCSSSYAAMGRHHCLVSAVLAQAGPPFRLFPRRGSGAPCGGNVPGVGRPLALE